jgi:hypothetical protein
VGFSEKNVTVLNDVAVPAIAHARLLVPLQFDHVAAEVVRRRISDAGAGRIFGRSLEVWEMAGTAMLTDSPHFTS